MFQKLQRNSFTIILMVGFLILGSRSFAQDDTDSGSQLTSITPDPEDKPAETPKAEAKKVNGPQIPADAENHDTKDLDALLKRYNDDAKKVLDDASKLHEIPAEGTTEVTEADINEMRPDQDLESVVNNKLKGKKNKDRPKVISSDFSNSVRMALEPLQKMSEPELLKRLDEATKNSPIRPYMDQFPNITIFTVRLIRDKESIPSLANALEDKNRLIRFAGAMIATIIFGFILKKAMHREGRSFLKSVLYFFLRMMLMSFIRFGLIYYFFSEELAPAIKVFKQTFI